MIENDVPDFIAPEECLSRYILQSNHIRKVDNTLKQDAFIPHPREDLSVTRHLNLGQEAIWAIGADVARQTGKKLYGRADNHAATYVEQKLSVLPAPIPGNHNHANVTGWPADKPSQKMIALEIAARSQFVPNQN